MLWPATITVYLHGTIETRGLTKDAVPALRDRVREIISAPVETSMKVGKEEESNLKTSVIG
jgi:hypothetical protein